METNMTLFILHAHRPKVEQNYVIYSSIHGIQSFMGDFGGRGRFA